MSLFQLNSLITTLNTFTVWNPHCGKVRIFLLECVFSRFFAKLLKFTLMIYNQVFHPALCTFASISVKPSSLLVKSYHPWYEVTISQDLVSQRKHHYSEILHFDGHSVKIHDFFFNSDFSWNQLRWYDWKMTSLRASLHQNLFYVKSKE